MNRQHRHEILLKIIAENDIETQQGLAEALKESGLNVTQATVSRDIQELGLTKVPSATGRPRYVKPLDPQLAKLRSMFHQSVISIEGVGNLIVIKTLPGTANSACVLVDKFEHTAIMGTVAGDDTILVIIREAGAVPGLVRSFKQLME